MATTNPIDTQEIFNNFNNREAHLGASGMNTEDNQEIEDRSKQRQAELARYINDTSLKKTLTIFVISFTSVWSIAILAFLFLYGFGKINCSDTVLIALITETLITVLGLPLVVTYHFFPKSR